MRASSKRFLLPLREVTAHPHNVARRAFIVVDDVIRPLVQRRRRRSAAAVRSHSTTEAHQLTEHGPVEVHARTHQSLGRLVTDRETPAHEVLAWQPDCDRERRVIRWTLPWLVHARGGESKAGCALRCQINVSWY